MSERPYLRLVPDPPVRPDRRHARRSDVVVFRVRVHLDDSTPTIWRQLDLRSDLTLDLLHQVLQVAFDWTDSHLHRFSLGGGAFDRHSQLSSARTTRTTRTRPKTTTACRPPRLDSTKPSASLAMSCTTSTTTATIGS